MIKKVIPCLDIKNGRVVKGQNFVGLVDAGDPVEFAKKYQNQGADELVFLDISATNEGRKTMFELLKKTIAAAPSLPITVGGGISTLSDIKKILDAGASKVSINSAAVKNPNLIRECVDTFGSSSLVIATDIKKIEADYNVFINGGKIDTNIKLLDWVSLITDMGAQTLLLTSMDNDGIKKGYDLDAIRLVKDNSSLKVIASGGGYELSHFLDAFTKGRADSVLAASVFHFGHLTVREVKEYLRQNNISVRL